MNKGQHICTLQSRKRVTRLWCQFVIYVYKPVCSLSYFIVHLVHSCCELFLHSKILVLIPAKLAWFSDVFFLLQQGSTVLPNLQPSSSCCYHVHKPPSVLDWLVLTCCFHLLPTWQRLSQFKLSSCSSVKTTVSTATAVSDGVFSDSVHFPPQEFKSANQNVLLSVRKSPKCNSWAWKQHELQVVVHHWCCRPTANC